MVDIFAATGIDPAEQKPDSSASNIEFSTAKGQTLKQLSDETPAHASTAGIADVGNLSDASVQQSGGSAQQTAPDPQQNTPSAQSPSFEAGGNLTPDAQLDQTPPIDKPAAFTNGTTDLLRAHDITPPAMQEINTNAFGSGVNTADPQTPEQKAVADYSNHLQDQYNTIAQTRYTPDQIQSLKTKGPIGFFEAFTKMQPWATDQVQTIANKLNGGQQISDSDHSKLQDYIDNQVELSQRGLSWDGKIAQAVTNLPTNLLSLASSPRDSGSSVPMSLPGAPSSTGATVPVMPAAYHPQYGETRLNDNVAVTDKGQMIYKAAQDAPATSSLKTFGYTLKNIGQAFVENAADALQVDRPLGLDLESNDYLSQVGVFNKPGESNALKFVNESLIRPAVSAADAALRGTSAVFAGGVGALREAAHEAGQDQLASTIEDLPNALMGEEMAGSNAFHAPGVSPILRSAVDKLPPEVQSRIYSSYKDVDPNAKLSEAFNSTGWHETLDKLGEENVSAAMRDAFDMDPEGAHTFDDYLKKLTQSPDQASVESGLVSINGGVHTATGLGIDILTNKGLSPSEAAETMQNMTAQEREDFVKRMGPDPTSDYPQIGLDEFENYHNSGVLSQQQEMLNRLESLRNPPKAPRANSLLQFLKDNGGIQDEGGELSNRDLVKGRPGLVNSKGMTLDDAALTAQEGGYFAGRTDSYNDRVSINDLLDHIDREAGGEKIYSHWDQEAVDQHNEILRGNLDMEQHLSAHGLHEDMADIDIIKGLGLDVPEAGQSNDNAVAITQAPVYADTTDIIHGQVEAAQTMRPPLIQDNQSAFNSVYRDAFRPLAAEAGKRWDEFYRLFLDDLHPVNELTKRAKEAGVGVTDFRNTKLLGAIVRHTDPLGDYNLTVATTLTDMDGNLVKTGKSFKAIHDDFHNMMMDIEPNKALRHQDFSDYQIARHLLDQDNKGNKIATPAQLDYYKNRVGEIATKYGSKFQWFETLASELTDARGRVLLNGVQAGRISQADYDKWREQYPNYVGLNRVLPKGEKVTSEPTSTDFPGARNSSLGKNVHVGSFKSLEGNSDLPFRDPLLNDMINTRAVMASAYRNHYIDTIYQMRDFAEGIKLEDPPIKSAAVFHSYDPKLRERLEQTVKQLGGSVERLKNVDVPGAKDALGSYSPLENLVRLKIGTTEGTLAHEVGHLLDEKLGLGKTMLADPEIKAELQKLAEDRQNADIKLNPNESDPDKAAEFEEKVQPVRAKFEEYLKSDPEIMANFYDAYVNSPEQVDETAPKARAAFEKIIEDNPKLAFLKDVKPSTNRAMEMIRPEVRESFGPKSSVPFYVDGKLKYLVVPPEIYEALNSFTPVQRTGVEKFMRDVITVPSKILRAGSTHIPTFMVGHFERSLGLSFLNGSATPVEWGKALFNIMDQGEEFKKWAASSGGMQMRKLVGEEGLGKELNKVFAPSSTQKFVKALGDIYDKTGRLAVYEKAKNEGASDLAAGAASSDATGNYFRGGKITKAANKILPFSNDAFQGADRFLRGYAKDPAGYTIRAMGALTLSQMFFSGLYLYGSDDETRKEYLRFTEQDRAAYMMVKAGGDWYKIRRPFAPGYIFGAVPEQVMLHLYDKNVPNGESFWQKLVSNMGNSIIPVDDGSKFIEPLTKTMIEMHDNEDWFKNKPIYPTYGKQVNPEDQVGSGTSETAKDLGQLSAKIMGKGNGINPSKFDFAVQSMLGTAGKYALQTSDNLINTAKSMTGQQVAQKPEAKGPDTFLSEATGLGALQERMPRGYWTQPVEDFYKNLDSVQADTSQIKGRGSKQAKQNAAPGMDILDRASREMSGENKQIKAITADTNLSPQEKRAQIEVHQENITSIAERANHDYYQTRGH